MKYLQEQHSVVLVDLTLSKNEISLYASLMMEE